MPIALCLIALPIALFADTTAQDQPTGCTITHPEMTRDNDASPLAGEAKLPDGTSVKVQLFVEENADEASDGKMDKLVAEGARGQKAVIFLEHDDNSKAFILDVNHDGRPEVVVTHSIQPELPPGLPPQVAAQMQAMTPGTESAQIFEWRGDAWKVISAKDNGQLPGKGVWAAKENGAGLTYTINPKDMGVLAQLQGPNAKDIVYKLKAGHKGGLAFASNNNGLPLMVGGQGGMVIVNGQVLGQDAQEETEEESETK